MWTRLAQGRERACREAMQRDAGRACAQTLDRFGVESASSASSIAKDAGQILWGARSTASSPSASPSPTSRWDESLAERALDALFLGMPRTRDARGEGGGGLLMSPNASNRTGSEARASLGGLVAGVLRGRSGLRRRRTSSTAELLPDRARRPRHRAVERSNEEIRASGDLEARFHTDDRRRGRRSRDRAVDRRGRLGRGRTRS